MKRTVKQLKAIHNFLFKDRYDNPEDNAKYSWLKHSNEQDGYQYFLDGFRVFRTTDYITEDSLEHSECNLGFLFRQHFNEEDGKKEIKLPTEEEISKYIKDNGGYYANPVYNFGKGLPVVNAVYLRDMIIACPNGTAYAVEKHNFVEYDGDGRYYNVYIQSGLDEALLLGMRVE